MPSDDAEGEVRVYRVTGARRAVCGLASGAMLELVCETPVPAALFGASPLRPLAARVSQWRDADARVEALLLSDAGARSAA